MLDLTTHAEGLAAHAGYRLRPADLAAAAFADPERVAVVLGATAGAAVIETLTRLLDEAVEHTREAIRDMTDEPDDSPTLRQAAGYLSWLLDKAAGDLEGRLVEYQKMLADALDALAHTGAVRPLAEARQVDGDLGARMAAQTRDLLDDCATAWGHHMDWVSAAQAFGPRLGQLHTLLEGVAGLAAAHLYQQLLRQATPAARADLTRVSNGDADGLAAAAATLEALTAAWQESLSTQAEHNRTVITHLAGTAKRARAWRRGQWRRTPPLQVAAEGAA